MGATKPEVVMPPLEHAAFSIAEFCSRNHIMRLECGVGFRQGRGPVEMRIGLNLIRITIESERAWQRAMQAPREDLETRAAERAVKAGSAAAKSSKHISKARRGRRQPPPPSGTGVRDE